MEEKDVMLRKILKVTYLSVQKFGISLNSVSSDKVQEKMEALLDYLGKKEQECLRIEKEIKKEEEKAKNEVIVSMVDFLGRRGFIQTAKEIQNEYQLEHLVDIEKYVVTKESVKNAFKKNCSEINLDTNELGTEDHSQAMRTAIVCRDFVRICESAESKESAHAFAKKYGKEIPSRILLLLVLPRESPLFSKISKEHKVEEITDFLMKDVSTKDKQNYFYQRVALGISGFITPACKEKEESNCPGCSRSVSRIAANSPKSMRSSSRPLCSLLHTAIPPSHATYITSDGKVYGECGAKILGYNPRLRTNSFKKCYFV
ncbi:macrophage erythroblast attacher [Nematocida minor]|uniref:macrophage erythroblast attacher n=1 Tax=Nematocida minor TaxID=1912983 RepID=UPI00221F7A49|nr:macrophage erythroblast attacher [Nematocida minor]KAI5191317.1 macrophage erythroblast attacher [Nematocida minor]